MFVFESKIHKDARDYEGFTVKVHVLPINAGIHMVEFCRNGICVLLTEEQFTALYEDEATDILVNAMEAAAE